MRVRKTVVVPTEEGKRGYEGSEGRRDTHGVEQVRVWEAVRQM